eukprot:Ihof_evm1s1077 gene=Ihof_evmTU1s1077
MLQLIATLVLIASLGNVGSGSVLVEIPLLGNNTSQSSTLDWENDLAYSNLAVDNDPDTWSHTDVKQSDQPWWKVDMGANYTVTTIAIRNRPLYLNRLRNVNVTVDDQPCNLDLVNGDMLNVMIHCPLQPRGRVLKIQLQDAPDEGILTLAEVKAWGFVEPVDQVEVNLIGHITTQSSVYGDWDSSLAVDGDDETWSHTEVNESDEPWWAVDLKGNLTVASVYIRNRPGWLDRLGNVVVTVDDKPCGPKLVNAGTLDVWIYCTSAPRGRYLMIQLVNAPESGILTLAEVKVYGYNFTETGKPVEPDEDKCVPDVTGLTCNDDQGKPNCTADDSNNLYATLMHNADDFEVPAMLGRSTPVSAHPNALNLFPNPQNVSLACLAPVGKGWVFFLGHEGLIKTVSTSFYNNLITYLARGEKVDASSSDYVEYVKSNLGYAESKSVGNKQLNDTDVYISSAYGLDDNVADFVRQGGILITGGHTWQNGNNFLKSAFNKAFLKDGVAYQPTYNADHYVVHTDEKPPVVIQTALDIIQIKESGVEAIFQRLDHNVAHALDVLANGLRAYFGLPNAIERVPIVKELYYQTYYTLTNNTAIWAIDLPISADEPVPFALLGVQSALNNVTPKNTSLPIPTMSHWPGPVRKNVKRVTKSVTVDLSFKFIDGRFAFANPFSWGIKHTGLYAAANEKIVVTIPEDLKNKFDVRIGLFSDSLWNLKNFKRFPDPLTTESRLAEIETVIYSPHGGQIVLMVPENTWGEQVITISGGSEMMTYTYGKTNQTAFKESVQEKHFPPYAEYHFDGGVFNLPTKKFRTNVDLDVMGKYWSHLIWTYKHFVNFTTPRDRPEEFVCDKQISTGFGHSGYPAMGTLVWPASMFDIVNNPTGGWGIRHEFGHNYQWHPWMLPPWVETSNNFMSLYFEHSYLNYTRWDHDNVAQLSGPYRAEMRKNWCSKPQKAQPKDIYVNLELLVELANGFGFDALIKHSGEFTRLPADTPLLNTTQKRYDQWFMRLCDIVQRDLTPQLVGIWKWEISKEVLESVQKKKYEKWVYPDMKN